MSYITAIGTANPPHKFSQAAIAGFMMKAMELSNGDSRKLRSVFKASGIHYRHSVLEDYGEAKDLTFFRNDPKEGSFPGTKKRLETFKEHALALSLDSVKDLMRSHAGVEAGYITHLIVVCCTGMYAPGLDVDLVKALGLASTIQRTAINFMGCHAAFNALKIADALCRGNDDAKILIVCTELCSLHFQKAATDDNILANALFADGSASLLVENRTRSRLKLKIETFHSDLRLAGHSDMAWTIGDVGFEMRLSSYVPELIRQGISDLMRQLLQKANLKGHEIGHYAIHPGGKRIIQVIQEELGIDTKACESAYNVLRNYGNMSSPTILFVLKEIISAFGEAEKISRVLAMAFGPGLTLESMVLNVESNEHGQS